MEIYQGYNFKKSILHFVVIFFLIAAKKLKRVNYSIKIPVGSLAGKISSISIKLTEAKIIKLIFIRLECYKYTIYLYIYWNRKIAA
jgi:hypothetical protein